MSNVIDFGARSKAKDLVDHLGVDHEEYRTICKNVLSTEDYEEFLLSSIDTDYYDKADEEIQDLVDAYLDRMNK